MREKEWNLCIWAHHIATFLGIGYATGVLTGKKIGKCRICVLVLFIESQAWGAVKIIGDLANGHCRLRDSFERLQRRSKNERQERKMIAGLTLCSLVFKLGVPWLAGR